jgi:hypothetical protein
MAVAVLDAMQVLDQQVAPLVVDAGLPLRARGSTPRPLGVARTAFFFTLQLSRSIEASVYLQLPSLGA